MAQRDTVSEVDFELEVLASTVPVLVDFQAAWCQPCALMSPVVRELGRELKGQVRTVSIDVDLQPAIADRYGITSIPTLLLFKNGQVVRQRVGAAPLAVLLAMVRDQV